MCATSRGTPGCHEGASRDCYVIAFAKWSRLAPNQSARFYHLKTMARPAGFEPAASRLEVSCSIQLSYGRVGWDVAKRGGLGDGFEQAFE